MKVAVIGAGLMGTAIAFDLLKNSSFNEVMMIDVDKETIAKAQKKLVEFSFKSVIHDVSNKSTTIDLFRDVDVVISAVPYFYNIRLTEICIKTGSHFIDLGGNNEIVNRQKNLYKKAENAGVTIIPDCGLAPGLVSIITRDIVDDFSDVEYVKIRVGGLPVNPQPPLNYQIVFSPNGLINEYVEDALILDHGSIKEKPSMTELEILEFPKPFGTMEAFLTSGGCSTLPYTFKDKISYLDYKTIRYPGHCEKMKTMLEFGFASDKPLRVESVEISPRDMLIAMLSKNIPSTGEDVVLLRVLCSGVKNGKKMETTYECIDYYDKKNNFTAMMRMTGIPVSVTADFICRGIIKTPGVFCSEEIIPSQLFFNELKHRNIQIQTTDKIIL